MKRRRRILGFGIGLALIITLVALVWHQRQIGPIVQIRREIERLKRLGEPTNWRDIIKPVPAHLDGMPLYRKAINQRETSARTLPETVWLAIADFGHPNPSVPVKLADVRKGIKAVQPALKTLRQAVELPHMRMVNWEQADQNLDTILFPLRGF